MKKIVLLCLLSSLLSTKPHAQDMDSVTQLIYNGPDDTLKVQRLLMVSGISVYSKPDSGLEYARHALHLSRVIKYRLGEAVGYSLIGSCLSQLGDYPGSLSFGFKALKLFQELNDTGNTILATEAIGTHYRDHGDFKQALVYLLKAYRLTETLRSDAIIGFNRETKDQCLMYQNAEIGFSYLSSHLDSAIFYTKKSYQIDLKLANGEWIYPPIVLGKAYSTLNEFDSAFHFYRLGLANIFESTPRNDVADNYIGIAEVFEKQQLYDSCIFYAKKGLEICENISYQKGIYDASGLLAAVYEKINPVESIKYYKLNKSTNDSLYSKDKERQVQSFTFAEQLQQQELQQKLEQTEFVYKNRLKIYILLAGLLLLIVVAGGLWRKNIYKQKSFALLQKQKQEIDIQKAKAEKTLDELKNTQSQLIQSEKMASLGELTAGIAHEIQNPLNFVNNFSEVSNELINEMNEELSKGDIQEAKAISSNIKQNLEKINHHGKRADAIVKGMLQHSRASSGQKELTDINALCDEYLRLAYHGLRAKDKDFNARLKSDFDTSIGKINTIPQDFGRVILNLINNAFYVVNEKQKQNVDAYEAAVSVTTKKLSDKILITVSDNGNGIPQKIVDKIFQPFFTTKPAGQGTGLGLSLSYDIIKAHGGEIKVESKEGEGSEFVIMLPNTPL